MVVLLGVDAEIQRRLYCLAILRPIYLGHWLSADFHLPANRVTSFHGDALQTVVFQPSGDWKANSRDSEFGTKTLIMPKRAQNSLNLGLAICFSEASEGWPTPALLTAFTRNWYSLPSLSPGMEAFVSERDAICNWRLTSVK